MSLVASKGKKRGRWEHEEAEMQKDAEAQVASERDVAAAGDRRRREQEARLETLVKEEDFTAAADLQAEMQKEQQKRLSRGPRILLALRLSRLR